MVCVLGVDPGKGGGLALVGEKLWVVPMPETLMDLWRELQTWKRDIDRAYLEDVHSMPGQGVVACFTFGRVFGHMEALLTALEVPIERVRPQVWQRALGIPPKKGSKGQHKARLKARAQELYPNIPLTLKTADALLIAHYGLERAGGLMASG